MVVVAGTVVPHAAAAPAAAAKIQNTAANTFLFQIRRALIPPVLLLQQISASASDSGLPFWAQTTALKIIHNAVNLLLFSQATRPDQR